nr:hypothetical protein [Candidatus Sigynarchaeota archaeon]
MAVHDGNVPFVLRTRKLFVAYFSSVIAVFFVFLGLSLALYPASFSILDDSVSTLGQSDQNPSGWVFFSIAMLFTSFSLIPVYEALYKKLHVINPPTSILIVLFYVITSVGIFMVGVFQEGGPFHSFHLYSAYFGFGGFFVSAVFTWFLLGKKIVMSSHHAKKHLLVAFCMQVTILSAGAAAFITNLVLSEMDIINFGGDPLGPYIGFPFTEWMLVFSIFIDKVFLCGILGS